MSDKNRAIFLHPMIISFMAILAMFEFIRMSLVVTFLPSFLTSLKYTTLISGIMFSAVFYADNLSKSAVGWFTDHYGPWQVLLIGSLTVFAGILMIMFFHQYVAALILASICIGLGVAPTWPAAVSGAIQIAGEDKRGVTISTISVVWLAGGGLGPVLMGFLIDSKLRDFLNRYGFPVFDAYKTCFIIMLGVAVLAIVMCALGWVGWHKTPHIQKMVEERKTVSSIERFKAIFHRLWEVKGLIPGMFFQALSLGMLFPILLPYTKNVLGLGESQYSLLLLIGGAVVVLFMIPVGRLADHWGTRGFLVSGFALASISIFLMITFGNKYSVWWIVGFVGFSYALIQPAWNTLLAGAIPPGQRGVFMGLFMSVEGFGFATGPIVGGLLGAIDKNNLLLPFYVSSVFLMFMAVVYLFYPFHQYQLEEQ